MSTQPVINKIKNIQNEAIKMNKYDYDRIMKDYDIAMRLKKMKQKTEKDLKEKHKLEQEKLKQMEEIREQLLSAKIKKVNNKRLHREKILSSRKDNLIKSSNFPKINPYQSNIDKMKEEEENYCIMLNEQILDKYEAHENNYNNYKREKKFKYFNTEKEYEKRAQKYKRRVELMDIKKLNEFNKQQIENSFSIKERFDRYRNPKIRKLKERNKKMLEDLKEKQYEIEQQDEKRKKEILKKLNHVNRLNTDDYKTLDFVHRKNLANLQKQNLERVNSERKEKYDWYILKQNDAFRWATDEAKEDNRIKKLSQQQSIITQQELDKKFEEFNRIIKDLEDKSILKKDNKERMKMFYQKQKELKEMKEKENQ